MLSSCCIPSDSVESLNADIAGDPIYQNAISDDIEEGQAFFITGKIFPNRDRFIVDFVLDNCNKDIALRVAARASANSLGRNSRIKRKWGVEETSKDSPISFAWDKTFEIQVFFNVETIFIAFDGMHLAKYVHRLPFNRIRSIDVRGDVVDIAVERKTLIYYPLRRRNIPHISQLRDRSTETADVDDAELDEVKCLPLPYYATFNEEIFEQSYSMVVKGYVSPTPDLIKVTLQVGQSFFPQPTVAMQIEIRLNEKRTAETDEPVIIFNSFANGKWIDEVKLQLETELIQPEAGFILAMVRGVRSFEIFWNNKHLYNYPYHMNPLCVNTCLVQGDLKLIDVLIEKK